MAKPKMTNPIRPIMEFVDGLKRMVQWGMNSTANYINNGI
jgi:hypothetical protein